MEWDQKKRVKRLQETERKQKKKREREEGEESIAINIYAIGGQEGVVAS